jgi:heme exporter protein C
LFVCLALSLVLIGYGIYIALVASPPEVTQGNMIRAFYYHFPNWIGTGIFLPANLIASVTYLVARNRNEGLAMKADAIALGTAEIGVLYCTLGLVTGSLWGREEWGIWWTWDARLTTTLILALIYVSYLLVRRMTRGSTKATVSAVLAVFGFLDIPIVYFSTTWWRTQHPAPVFGGGVGSGVAASILTPTLWNVAAWVSWGIVICVLRSIAELRIQEQARREFLLHLSDQTETLAQHV